MMWPKKEKDTKTDFTIYHNILEIFKSKYYITVGILAYITSNI